MSVFLLFELLLFITWKVVSFVENIIKQIFLAHIAKQNMAEKWPILAKTMHQLLWGNVTFSTFLTCCFYSLERRFFLEYHKNTFSLPTLPKKYVGKKAHFRPKTWINNFGKMSTFGLFKLLFCYSVKRRFFV